MNYADDLSRCLRYSIDNYRTLLHSLENDPAKWATGSELRAMAADAAQEYADDLASDHPQKAEAAAVSRLLGSEHPIYWWRGLPHWASGNRKDADRFTDAYHEASTWASSDSLGRPLDSHLYRNHELEPSTHKEMDEDAAHFFHSYHHLLECGTDGPDVAGHDFWMTRNRHGTGFWDRQPNSYVDGLGTNSAQRLSDAAHSAGGYYLSADEPDEDAEGTAGGYIYGNGGGSHRWGQPAGLPE